MFKKFFSVYLGTQTQKGYTGFISEEKFFLILAVEEGLNQDEGQEFLASFKTGILSIDVNNLADFETYINEKIKEKNLPTTFSLSAGFLKGNILYLKTVGQGEIYIYRAGKLVPIIKGDLSASGYVNFNDLVIFTISSFLQTLGGEKELKDFLDHKSPNEIVNQLSPILKGKNDGGLIALFIKFINEEEGLTFQSSIGEKIFSLYKNILSYQQKLGRKKTFTFLAVVFIFFILLWSVGFGYQRRREGIIQKKIHTVKVLITQKLNEADESSFFSISKSKALIEEAKNEVNKLKKEIGQRKELNELIKLIEEKEKKILKKEEKAAEEFFDLTVDSKEAKGKRLYLSDDSVTILNSEGGVIYNLSLTKKSLDKKNFSEIKKATLLASYQGEIIFYIAGDGLYKITSEEKLKKIIEKDNDWGNIIDFWIYNSNLYLLDEGKSEIYKYLVTDEGYSDKISYFKGGDFGLKNANSLAIDSSVYVGFSDHIFKFTAGSQDEFKTLFPESSVKIAKIFTTKDLQKVYAWDKFKGSIYVLGKNGAYEREINSSLLKQAIDFVVYQNSAYILSGSKIYKINLD